MNNKTPGILFLVEGAKTDFSLMKKLLDIYSISDSYKIISYNILSAVPLCKKRGKVETHIESFT